MPMSHTRCRLMGCSPNEKRDRPTPWRELMNAAIRESRDRGEAKQNNGTDQVYAALLTERPIACSASPYLCLHVTVCSHRLTATLNATVLTDLLAETEE